MRISETIYGPFERLIRPLEIPYRPVPSGGPVAVLVHFISLFRGVLVALSLSSMAIESINLTVVWGLSVIVDGVGKNDAATFVQSHVALLGLLAIMIFPGMPLASFLVNMLSSHTIGVSMPAAIHWQGHQAVERQDLAFFHEVFPGQVAVRLAQAGGAIQQQLILLFQNIPRFAVQMIGSIFLLVTLSWQLAIPVIMWVAINIVLSVRLAPQLVERARNTARQRSLVVGATTDLYANIQMIKQFAAEDTEAGSIRRTIRNTLMAQHAEQRIYRRAEIGVVALTTALWLGMSVIGFSGLIGNFLSVGEFVGAIYLLNRLSSHTFTFLQMGQQMYQGLGTIRDAMSVMTTLPQIKDQPTAFELECHTGSISFNKVSFAYQKNVPVVDNLTLTIRPNEKVGLVGISGAGKTTLANLLLRFYDVDCGSIEIDGQEIRSVTLASLRRSIGIIAQDVSLLQRSVADNIRIGRPGATLDEIVKCAMLADAHKFVCNLTDNEGRIGYEAFVGARGVKLSGGQRQRVAIARVLLKNAPILILDEATSALDSESESAIQTNLNQLMESKTVIAIAHRLSTISKMDRIVVLEGGKIAEHGTLDELINSGGLFARLWGQQTGGFISREGSV